MEKSQSGHFTDHKLNKSLFGVVEYIEKYLCEVFLNICLSYSFNTILNGFQRIFNKPFQHPLNIWLLVILTWTFDFLDFMVVVNGTNHLQSSITKLRLCMTVRYLRYLDGIWEAFPDIGRDVRKYVSALYPVLVLYSQKATVCWKKKSFDSLFCEVT